MCWTSLIPVVVATVNFQSLLLPAIPRHLLAGSEVIFVFLVQPWLLPLFTWDPLLWGSGQPGHIYGAQVA